MPSDGLGASYAEHRQGAETSEEINTRALAIALEQPGVLTGGLGWDALWLRLGEELGWENVGLIDHELLQQEIEFAVEMDRVRRAGWRTQEIDEHETRLRLQAVVQRGLREPAERFDVLAWVEPLIAEEHRELLRQRAKDWQRHPELLRGDVSDYVSVWAFDPRHYVEPGEPEATLRALGAPTICRALRLFEPLGEGDVPAGTKLPLREALEILTLHGDQDQILLCLPGVLAYVTTHEQGRTIVHRPVGPR